MLVAFWARVNFDALSPVTALVDSLACLGVVLCSFVAYESYCNDIYYHYHPHFMSSKVLKHGIHVHFVASIATNSVWFLPGYNIVAKFMLSLARISLCVILSASPIVNQLYFDNIVHLTLLRQSFFL